MTCEFVTAFRRMRRSTRADVTLAALVSVKLSTFPPYNHLRHSRGSEDASRCVFAAIFCMDQLLISVQSHTPRKTVCLLELPPLTVVWHPLLLRESSDTRTKFLSRFLPLNLIQRALES